MLACRSVVLQKGVCIVVGFSGVGVITLCVGESEIASVGVFCVWVELLFL